MLQGQPRLFLDADGVLADFDAGAKELLGMTPAQFEARHGRREFWRRIATARNFYGTLPEMPDARRLFDAVEHLRPTILTGLPLGDWAAPQKVKWAAEHFPGVPIITCMARDKHRHMEPSDVRVDQPGAVAALSLIDWSKVRRRSGWRCGSAAAAQKAAGSHGRAEAPISRSYKKRY